jgi:hypothetical protein
VEVSALDRLPFDQVFLNNSIQQVGRNAAIPDSLGINDDNRSALADAEAITLRTLHGSLSDLVIKPQLFQTFF